MLFDKERYAQLSKEMKDTIARVEKRFNEIMNLYWDTREEFYESDKYGMYIKAMEKYTSLFYTDIFAKDEVKMERVSDISEMDIVEENIVLYWYEEEYDYSNGAYCGVEKENVTFPVEWLNMSNEELANHWVSNWNQAIDSNYKKAEQEEINKAIKKQERLQKKEEKEYQEYLRLKEKFENSKEEEDYENEL
jgi:hypothetical protein